MSKLYLILHKVRGQPAYDIAELVPLFKGEPPVWQIPTSGHSAYPIASWPLEDLVDSSVGPECERPYDRVAYDHALLKCLAEVRDHYEVNKADIKPKISVQGFLQKLGLAKSVAPIKKGKLG